MESSVMGSLLLSRSTAPLTGNSWLLRGSGISACPWWNVRWHWLQITDWMSVRFLVTMTTEAPLCCHWAHLQLPSCKWQEQHHGWFPLPSTHQVSLWVLTPACSWLPRLTALIVMLSVWPSPASSCLNLRSDANEDSVTIAGSKRQQ